MGFLFVRRLQGRKFRTPLPTQYLPNAYATHAQGCATLRAGHVEPAWQAGGHAPLTWLKKLAQVIARYLPNQASVAESKKR